MINDLMKINSRLQNCLQLAFSSASIEKQKQLHRILEKTALSIEDAIRNPIRVPGYLLMKISKELGTTQTICEIMMAHQLNRVDAR